MLVNIWIVIATVLIAFGSDKGYGQVIMGLDSPDKVPNSYLVCMKGSYDQNTFQRKLLAQGIKLVQTFNFGFEDILQLEADTPGKIQAMLTDQYVEFVEANQAVSVSQNCNDRNELNSGIWGLRRINKRDVLATADLSLNGYSYEWQSAFSGNGVDVYVLDTGIMVDNNEFEGRVVDQYVASSLKESTEDLNGHGTHVAGIIGGKTYGVAKNVSLISVKVLGADGNGSIVTIYEGLQYAFNVSRQRRNPTIINLSLGGEKAPRDILVEAVKFLVRQNIVVVAAAGNENDNACNYTPAASPDAITVGATDKNDKLTSFSNHGCCVDILAPGKNITSAWIGGPNALATISGTSMATPLVAGAAAVYMNYVKSVTGSSPTPKEVKAHLLKYATNGAIDCGNYSDTTLNRLLYTYCTNVLTICNGVSSDCEQVTTNYCAGLTSSATSTTSTTSTTPGSATTIVHGGTLWYVFFMIIVIVFMHKINSA